MAKKKQSRSAKHRTHQPRPLGPMESAFLQELGQNIKTKRNESGLTASEVARHLGLTINSQFYREAGSVKWPISDLAKYASLFGCSPRDLIPDSLQSATPQKSRRSRPASASSPPSSPQHGD